MFEIYSGMGHQGTNTLFSVAGIENKEAKIVGTSSCGFSSCIFQISGKVVSMIRKIIVAVFCFAASLSLVSAEEFGTEEEARAMLDRAINLVKIDKTRAMDAFTDLEGGFKVKDLYVFCANRDGIIIAHPTLLGMSMIGVEDEDGNNLWELVSSPKRGEIKQITYKLARPTTDSTETFLKNTFVTKVMGAYCGVGYYDS